MIVTAIDQPLLSENFKTFEKPVVFVVNLSFPNTEYYEAYIFALWKGEFTDKKYAKMNISSSSLKFANACKLVDCSVITANCRREYFVSDRDCQLIEYYNQNGADYRYTEDLLKL